MKKDEIVAVIRKNMVEHLDDVDPAELERAESFRDFGANSLDMLEVVTASMREMNIRVPRAELAEIKTIDGLAEKFLKYV
jgi:acyl carrier protein